MKISIYMMADADGDLADRLESLTGQPAACCVDRLSQLEADVAEDVDLDATLARLRALADDKRLKVAAMLARTEELCACEIQALLGVTHATVSHHMDALVDAGLVDVDRRGRWAYYSLTGEGKEWAP